MGVTPTAALGAVRLCLGRATTTDISTAAAILTAANTLAAGA